MSEEIKDAPEVKTVGRFISEMRWPDGIGGSTFNTVDPSLDEGFGKWICTPRFPKAVSDFPLIDDWELDYANPISYSVQGVLDSQFGKGLVECSETKQDGTVPITYDKVAAESLVATRRKEALELLECIETAKRERLKKEKELAEKEEKKRLKAEEKARRIQIREELKTTTVDVPSSTDVTSFLGNNQLTDYIPG